MMVRQSTSFKRQQRRRLQKQLLLAAANPAISTDERLRRLVQHASRQLRRTQDVDVVAYQIAVELGYYLFCHHYQMPRAAFDLLAVVQAIHAHRLQSGQLVELPLSE